MSRLTQLVQNPRRTLAALATVAAASALTVASGANFTAQAANPANTFATGTLSIDAGSPSAAVFSAAGVRPGDATTGTVDIANSGSLSGAFTLERSAPVDSDQGHPLSARLQVTVVDCGSFAAGTPTCDGADPVRYSGTLAQMGTAGHAIDPLGTFAAGEKRWFQFRVVLDATAGNEYQGASSSVEFTWHAA